MSTNHPHSSTPDPADQVPGNGSAARGARSNADPVTGNVGTRAPAPRPPDTRTAKSSGLAVAAVGVVLFNVAVFLSWVTTSEMGAEMAGEMAGEDMSVSGFETDSLVPFIAYLGIGLVLAMAYAKKRTRRGQHRGLTLVSMAVAIAATLQAVAFAIDPMGGLERGFELVPQVGVYLAIIGAAIWAIGSGLLAKEIEGDDEDDDTTLVTRGAR